MRGESGKVLIATSAPEGIRRPSGASHQPEGGRFSDRGRVGVLAGPPGGRQREGGRGRGGGHLRGGKVALSVQAGMRTTAVSGAGRASDVVLRSTMVGTPRERRF
jgi:hypothetical protein